MNSGIDNKFGGRTVIVTGAGQGLGRAYAKRFATLGASVAVVDINGDNAKRVTHEIENMGGRATAIATDITQPTATDDMVSSVLKEFGQIHVLVNNAAMSSVLGRQPFTEISFEEWQRVLSVNITGTYLCARSVTPVMKANGWGRIINISSTTVIMGRINMLHYVASKAAVIGMTRSMARELGAFGITVNVLLPGLTPTEVGNDGITTQGMRFIKEMQCIPRQEVPEDLTEAVVFLASEGAGFVTGQSLAVDGGAVHV